MSHLMANNSNDFTASQFSQQAFINTNKMLVSNPVILSTMIVILPTCLDFYLCGWEVRLKSKVLHLVQKLRVHYILELVEEYNRIGVNLSVCEGDDQDENLQKNILRFSAYFNYS